MNKIPSYDISVVPRGFGVIIVNKFENCVTWKREGAEKEIDNLTHLFNSLGLTPIVHTELRKQDILNTLEEVSKRPELGEQSMIAIAIRLVSYRELVYIV